MLINYDVSFIIIFIYPQTGKAPPPLFPIPHEEDDDTPRTYRSEADPPPPPKGKKGKKGHDDPESLVLSREDAVDMLKNTFNFFKRAVVSDFSVF